MPFPLNQSSGSVVEEKNRVVSFNVYCAVSEEQDQFVVESGEDLSGDDPEGAYFFTGRFYTINLNADFQYKNGKRDSFCQSYRLGSPECSSLYETTRWKFIEDLSAIFVFAMCGKETTLYECRGAISWPNQCDFCRDKNGIAYLAVNNFGYYLTNSDIIALGECLYEKSRKSGLV